MKYQRAILHVDANAAFLSWSAIERLNHGEALDIRTIPAVIGGDEEKRHGIVLAKSDPAKKIGIYTGETLFSARYKCPDLMVYPADLSVYSAFSYKMYRLLTAYTPLIERYSIDECFLDITGMEKILNMDALKTAHTIGKQIREELGFTVNVGVGPNKVLAKMAGELRKPDCVNTLYPEEIPYKLWPLPVGELFMVGRRSEKILINHGIRTIGDLAHTDTVFLKSYLKSHGLLIWSYANGIDASPVMPRNILPPKSYSHSITMSRDLNRFDSLYSAMLPFCESTASHMRQDGFLCRNVSVFLKYNDFSKSSQQKMLHEPTDRTNDIILYCRFLLEHLWNGMPVRQIGVRLSCLEQKDFEQLTFFDSLPTQKQKSMDTAMDQIRKKYGRKALCRASSLNDNHIHLDHFISDSKNFRIPRFY